MDNGKSMWVISQAIAYYREHPDSIIYVNSKELERQIHVIIPKTKVKLVLLENKKRR